VDLQKLLTYVPALIDGCKITVMLTVISVSVGMILGLFLALGRISKNIFIDGLCKVYIFVFRGSPLMMQIFFIYYALPLIYPAMNISDKFTAACIALSLNSAAYLAEIIRAAIQSIDKGQFEAAKALGMNYSLTMRRVVIPQSYRRLIPPVGNEFIAVIKDTALVSAIGLTDLMRITNQIQVRNGDPWIYVPSLVIYLLLTTIFTFVFDKLEKKYSIYE